MQKIVLIVATGRSGSTTLQRILNTIPNSNITGENNGSINKILEFYHSILNSHKNIPKNIDGTFKSKQECENQKIKSSWYNSFDLHQITNDTKKLILDIIDNNNKIIGFKEIRYFNLLHLLDVFKMLFPDVKIIIHYRENIIEQSISGWWKNNKDSIQYLSNYNKQLINYYHNNMDFCFLSTFEKIFDTDNIKNLFSFLGEDFDQEKYINIINNNLE